MPTVRLSKEQKQIQRIEQRIRKELFDEKTKREKQKADFFLDLYKEFLSHQFNVEHLFIRLNTLQDDSKKFGIVQNTIYLVKELFTIDYAHYLENKYKFSYEMSFNLSKSFIAAIS